MKIKKITKVISLLLIICFIMPLFYCACSLNLSMKAPTFLHVQETENSLTLETETNVKTGAYIFYVTANSENYDDINNYQTFDSNSNIFDLANICTQENTTYYFYSQFKGDFTYANSGLSPIASYTKAPALAPLTKPEYLTVTKSENSVILSTNQNSITNSYIFYLTSNIDFSTLSNYTQYKKTTNSFDVTQICTLANTTYHFYVQFEGDSTYSNSPLSDIAEYNRYAEKTNLIAPEITNFGTDILWDAVPNATSYVVSINSVEHQTTNTQINLSSFTPLFLNSTYTVKVKAIADETLFNPSSYSSEISIQYTRKTPYQTQRFYWGEYKDYYVENQNEFTEIVLYALTSRLDTITFYCENYDESTSQTKISNAYNQYEGTYKFSFSYEFSLNIFELNINYTAGKEPTLQSTSSRVNATGVSGNYSLTGRDENFNNFKNEQNGVEIDCAYSEQLLWTVIHSAKPTFSIAGTTAETIYNNAKNILRQIIDDIMTDYQKAVAIHDYLICNVTYDHNVLPVSSDNQSKYRSHYLEGALIDNLAVCDGFSKAYSFLCAMEGIESVIVSGTASGGGHAWNKINIVTPTLQTKAWYTLDLTFDNFCADSENEYLTHNYFITKDSMLNNRVENSYSSYPQSLTDFNYYENAYLDTAKTINLSIEDYADLTALRTFLSVYGTNYKMFELIYNSNNLSQSQINSTFTSVYGSVSVSSSISPLDSNYISSVYLL